MEYTKNLNLRKPGYDDPIDIQDFNTNADTIDDKIGQILQTIQESPEYQKDEELIDIRKDHEGNVHESAGAAVRSLGAKIEAIEEQMSNVPDHPVQDITADDLGLEQDNNGMIYPTLRGVRSANGMLLSTFESIFRLRMLDSIPATFSVALGSPAIVGYNFIFSENSVLIGVGNAEYYVNGTLVSAMTIPQGDNFSDDLGKYLRSGNNEVSVIVKNADGESKSLSWTIEAVEVSITSTFDYTLAYGSDITFKYTVYGDVEKEVHFILDGVPQETMIVESSGRQITKTFTGLSHGLHTLDVYATAKILGSDIESNHLIYDIIVNTDGSVEPIISLNSTVDTLLQGEIIDLPYIVYDPLATESNAILRIYTLKDGSYELYKEEVRTVDRSLQHWTTRSYPLGTVKFEVALRDVSRSKTVEVKENALPISPATNDLELHLSSANRSNSEENPNSWVYGDIETEFENVNWASSGWMIDNAGDTALHLAGGSKATIKFQPFSEDLRVYGKTIEFDFAVRDVNNREATVISCMSGDIGLEITADTGRLKSSLSSVECSFRSERRMRIAFVIEASSEYRLMSIYLDGVLTRAKQYVTTDNFQQTTPVDITIGSPYCAVDLYTVRSYSTALTQEELRDNYICDIVDVLEKSEVYDANDLYDSARNLVYEKVKKKIPVMTIIGSLPASKGDKKIVGLDFENPFDESKDFKTVYGGAIQAEIDVQGTSSQWYVRKNWKIKLKKKDDEGNKIFDYPAYQHMDNSIPSQVFCMKADYAEATSTHNTQIANFVHSLYSDKTPAQLEDSRCRTTIQGFPCVIYHKETEDSTPIFLGKYNFNYDKGSEEVFGFDENFDVESWEFCNNTSTACNFLGPIPESYKMKDENDNEVGWVNDFERRYPDHDDIEEGKVNSEEAIARFRAMHNWVVSTKDYDLSDAATLERYRTEFQEKFNLHKVLVYYVFTFFLLMVDQRAKNMFMTYWASTGKWEPWFYDNDTCLGINNEGQLIFDYYHEDTDIMEDGTKVYNGQDSVLWNKFRVAFATEIQETYKALRGSKNEDTGVEDGKLTYNTLRNQFVVEGSDKWSESIYNEDSDYKYISMLRSKGDATNVPQVRGTGEHHLEYFLEGRFNYCDSKWYSPYYANDHVVLRVNTPKEWKDVEPNANITITPFSDMYAGVRYRANGTLQQKRLKKNETYTFIAPVSGPDDAFSDTETAIYGASQLSSIGDLSPLYCNYCDVSKATKLIDLKLGSDSPDYESKLTVLSLGTNRLLKKLDIRNCKSLSNPVDLTGCSGIEEVYAQGSSISSLDLADSGYLKIVHLPDTVSTLTIKNQDYLETFTMTYYNEETGEYIASYRNITKLHIVKSKSIPIDDILLGTPLLDRVRLVNVEWSCSEEELSGIYQKLKSCGGIDENGYNIEKAVVSGIVSVPTISEELLRAINTDFPELMISVNGVILCTISYYNYDGTLLHVTTVERGTDAPDIVLDETIDTPVREDTIDYHYEYKGWSDSLENIQKSKSFVATYNVFYAVRFYNGDNLLYMEYVSLGDTVTDPIVSGKIGTPTKESTAQYDYTFEEWDNVFADIKGVTVVNAVFTETIRSYQISFYNEDILLLQYIREYGQMPTYDLKEPQKLNVEYPQDYKFLGWSPEISMIEGDAVYVAEFAESDHVLDDWDTISANVSNGTYKELYPIGALKREVLTYEDGSTELIELEVVGHDHDDLAYESGKAGLSWMIKGVLKEPYIMNNSQDLNRVSWEGCDNRKYLNEVILPALSEELQRNIVPIIKKTSAGGGSTDVSKVISTVDAIWKPSLVEIIDTYSSTEIYAAEGHTYAQMIAEDEESSRARRIKYNYNGAATRYWTRSPVPSSSNEYWMISTLGGGISLYASYASHGNVFGICVGKYHTVE